LKKNQKNRSFIKSVCLYRISICLGKLSKIPIIYPFFFCNLYGNNSLCFDLDHSAIHSQKGLSLLQTLASPVFIGSYPDFVLLVANQEESHRVNIQMEGKKIGSKGEKNQVSIGLTILQYTSLVTE